MADLTLRNPSKTGPSRAERAKPSSERLLELKRQGMSDQQASNVLESEGYKRNEMSGAIGVDVRTLDLWIRGASGGRNERALDAGVGGGQGSGGTREGFISQYPATSVLLGQLRLVSGLGRGTADSLAQAYEENIDFFNENPMQFYLTLQNAGVSNQRAQNILTIFYTKANPKALPAVMGLGGGFNPQAAANMPADEIDKMFARMEKMMAFKMMMSLNEEKQKPDIFERAEEAQILARTFGGNGRPQPYDTVIREIPMLDPEGKVMHDESGQVMVERVYEPKMTGSEGGARSVDPFDKMLEQMGKVAMVKMLTGVGGGMGGPQGPYGAFPLQEPVLDEENHPVLDQYKQPIMRTTGYWTPGIQGAGKGSELIDGMKLVAEIVKPKEGSGESKIVDTLLATVKERDAQAMGDLRQSIRELQGNDPLSYALDMVGKLKDLGIISGKSGPESVEAIKLDLDFKKWAKEHDDILTKWIWEQKEKQLDQKYAREQLTELGKTVREGIEKVGKPLAEGFGAGYKVGASKSGSPQQDRRQGAPAEKGVKEMTPEELTEYLAKAEQAEKVVETAKGNVIAEMHARGLPL